jgi:hypothetical protein
MGKGGVIVGIQFKKLYSLMTIEALLDELIELSSETHMVASYDLDKHYEKISLIKEEIIKRFNNK